MFVSFLISLSPRDDANNTDDEEDYFHDENFGPWVPDFEDYMSDHDFDEDELDYVPKGDEDAVMKVFFK